LIRRLISAGLVLALAACDRHGLDRLTPGETGRVAEIRSGDTMVLEGGLVVRLAGVDAPNQGEPHAAEAAASLARQVAGKEVRLLYGGQKRDSYGRALAQVRLKGDRAWLQEGLLKDGAAWVRTYPDNRALAAQMLAVEQAARTAKKGVWALQPALVRLPVEVTGKPGFHIVEGRVTAVTLGESGTDLTLDGVVRATVPGRRAQDFALMQIDLPALRGKLVRIRGFVRRGGEMVLDHPEQLEVFKVD
jgi:micrococcal nuclease